jgi:mannitol-1-phosphate 5-dehydrogenase
MERDGFKEQITNFSAVEIDSPLFFEHFAQADVVTTAVSMGVLEKLAPIIATALCKRHTSGCDSPLNIICCENGVRATTQLKNFVFQHLDTLCANWCRRTVGFADCSVDRIVPIATFDNPLDVGVERYCEWNIDSGQIVGALPNIVGVHFTENLEALVERKLYTLNTAHCATAYLGAQKGYKFIHEAVTDPDIRQLVEQIMAESSAPLCAKFGIDSHLKQHYAQSVLHRFENPLLA